MHGAVEIREEVLRAALLHFLPGSSANRRVRGDEANRLHRAMLRGTPIKSAVILQGIDGTATDVVEIDAASFYGGENSCCFVWLPRSE